MRRRRCWRKSMMMGDFWWWKCWFFNARYESRWSTTITTYSTEPNIWLGIWLHWRRQSCHAPQLSRNVICRCANKYHGLIDCYDDDEYRPDDKKIFVHQWDLHHCCLWVDLFFYTGQEDSLSVLLINLHNSFNYIIFTLWALILSLSLRRGGQTDQKSPK